MSVLNATLVTTATYAAGRSFEASAVLGANETIGWTTASSSAVRMSFSVNASKQLIATVNDGGKNSASGVAATNWTAAAHRFRIEWTSTSATFYVDNTQVYTHAFATTFTNLRPTFTDTGTTDGALVVDWVRVAPYAATGSLTSRVFDAQAPVSWDSLSWDADVPAGTTLVVQVRTGNTATPDGTWSAWSTVTTSGGSVPGGTARYLQYQLTLTSSGNRFVSPTVRSVTAALHAP